MGNLTDIVYIVYMAVRPYSGSLPGCHACQLKRVPFSEVHVRRVTWKRDRHIICILCTWL